MSIAGGARPLGTKLGQMAFIVIFSACKPAFSPILLARPIHPNFAKPYCGCGGHPYSPAVDDVMTTFPPVFGSLVRK